MIPKEKVELYRLCQKIEKGYEDCKQKEMIKLQRDDLIKRYPGIEKE